MRHLLVLLAGSACLAGQAPTWEALEARGARIARVEVRVLAVFDPAVSAESTWVGRTANALHVDTRPSVVRQFLTFGEGSAVEVRRIRESERELRASRFLKDARIEPEVAEDGAVTARVTVRDAWTLKASVGFSQVGGQQRWGFSLRDQNIVGTGKDLIYLYDRGPERTTQTLRYGDRHLFGSRWQLQASYQHLSDGRSWSAGLARPFTSLDTPWAVEAGASAIRSTLLVHDREAQVYTAPSVLRQAQLGAAVRAQLEGDTVLRVGLRLESRQADYGPLTAQADPGRLAPPDLRPRDLRGAALTFEWLEDRFAEFRNIQGTDFVEDHNLGWRGRVALGRYDRSLGSRQEGLFARGDLSKGWLTEGRTLVLLQAGATGRDGVGAPQDQRASLAVATYTGLSSRQALATWVALDAAHDPDPEQPLYLGGEDGLRGYPNFLHLGDRRWLASVEDRILLDQRWLGILRLGFVLYADAGAIRRRDGSGWTRTYANVGGGFRFGDLKSSLGKVVLLTVAFPLVREPGLDRYQLVVGNVVHF